MAQIPRYELVVGSQGFNMAQPRVAALALKAEWPENIRHERATGHSGNQWILSGQATPVASWLMNLTPLTGSLESTLWLDCTRATTENLGRLGSRLGSGQGQAQNLKRAAPSTNRGSWPCPWNVTYKYVRRLSDTYISSPRSSTAAYMLCLCGMSSVS